MSVVLLFDLSPSIVVVRVLISLLSSDYTFRWVEQGRCIEAAGILMLYEQCNYSETKNIPPTAKVMLTRSLNSTKRKSGNRDFRANYWFVVILYFLVWKLCVNTENLCRVDDFKLLFITLVSVGWYNLFQVLIRTNILV